MTWLPGLFVAFAALTGGSADGPTRGRAAQRARPRMHPREAQPTKYHSP